MTGAMVKISLVVPLLVLLDQIHPRPLKSKNKNEVIDDQHFAYDYLVKYGYMNNDQESLESSKLQSLSLAVTDFQSFTGLNTTGTLDQQTMEMMKLRRCGVKDSVSGRTKRFALQGSR